MPKVSVVIPIYNASPYLRECLDSVCGQSLKDIEIVCVNDGSTDDSLSIIKEYEASDERIVVIDKPNSGYGDSMNIGMETSTGEFIGIVEPDDYILPDMYCRLYSVASELDLDMIKSDHIRFKSGHGHHRKTRYMRLTHRRGYYGRVLTPHDETEVFEFTKNNWTGIYRRSFIMDNGIRHNTTPGASFQDLGFWFQTLALADSAFFLDEAYYMYRKDNPSSSLNSGGKVFAVCDEFYYIQSFLEKKPSLKNILWETFCFHRASAYFANTNRIDDEFRAQFDERFGEDIEESVRMGWINWKDFSPNAWNTILLSVTPNIGNISHYSVPKTSHYIHFLTTTIHNNGISGPYSLLLDRLWK